MDMPKILVVDDEEDLCEILKFNLEIEGYEVDTAFSAEEALKMDIASYQLLLLDVMMGEISGFKMASILKKEEKTADIPIIFLTAKDTENDMLTGFNLGADDYISKPFSIRQVVARVKAVLRRTQGKNDNAEESKKVVTYDKLEINIANYELKVNGVQIDTPPKELELIYHFASNPNRVFTRDQLLDEVWGFEFYGDSRTVDVHVKRLREKLEGVSDKWELKTVWGVGYKFETKE